MRLRARDTLGGGFRSNMVRFERHGRGGFQSDAHMWVLGKKYNQHVYYYVHVQVGRYVYSAQPYLLACQQVGKPWHERGGGGGG